MNLYNDDNDYSEFKSLIAGLAGPTATSKYSFTPPPAAAEPQYQQRVGGREFGVGDIAMLGGIIASLIGKKPGVAASLAGQYGGAVMQDQSQRDTQNREIDRYNNKLANEKDDPMARWQAENNAKLAAANLEQRTAENDLQRDREGRLLQHQYDEADPESPLNKQKLTYQQKLAEIATGERLKVANAEQANKIALLAEVGKYRGGRGGGAAAPKPVSAAKQQAGGDPKAKPLKPDNVPLDGYDVADSNQWNAVDTVTRRKLAAHDMQMRLADESLRKMAKIREAVGGESATFGDAEQVGAYNTAKAQLAAAMGEIKNIGVISPTEMAMINSENIPTLDKEARDMANGVLGDKKLGLLNGTRKQLEDLRYSGMKTYGLTKAAGKPATASPSGAKAYVVTDAQGQKHVAQMTEEEAQKYGATPYAGTGE